MDHPHDETNASQAGIRGPSKRTIRQRRSFAERDVEDHMGKPHETWCIQGHEDGQPAFAVQLSRTQSL